MIGKFGNVISSPAMRLDGLNKVLYLYITSILSVCGKLENKTTIDKASSRSRIASMKVGYLQVHLFI
jgi:hypothetical protein